VGFFLLVDATFIMSQAAMKAGTIISCGINRDLLIVLEMFPTMLSSHVLPSN